MNNLQIWSDIVEIIYREKKAIISELRKYSIITAYNSSQKTLNINVSKTYLESLVKSNVEQIKTLFERLTQKPVSLIYVNNKLVEIQIIKKLDPIDTLSTPKEEEITKKPIAYKSVEQTFNESIFIKQHELEKKIKSKTVNLDFHNKLLEDTKTLIFHKEDEEYKKYYIIAIVTIVLVLPSIVFFVLGRSKQKRFIALDRKVRELIVMKYRAVNYHAKIFMKNSFR